MHLDLLVWSLWLYITEILCLSSEVNSLGTILVDVLESLKKQFQGVFIARLRFMGLQSLISAPFNVSHFLHHLNLYSSWNYLRNLKIGALFNYNDKSLLIHGQDLMASVKSSVSYFVLLCWWLGVSPGFWNIVISGVCNHLFKSFLGNLLELPLFCTFFLYFWWVGHDFLF